MSAAVTPNTHSISASSPRIVRRANAPMPPGDCPSPAMRFERRDHPFAVDPAEADQREQQHDLDDDQRAVGRVKQPMKAAHVDVCLDHARRRRSRPPRRARAARTARASQAAAGCARPPSSWRVAAGQREQQAGDTADPHAAPPARAAHRRGRTPPIGLWMLAWPASAGVIARYGAPIPSSARTTRGGRGAASTRRYPARRLSTSGSRPCPSPCSPAAGVRAASQSIARSTPHLAEAAFQRVFDDRAFQRGPQRHARGARALQQDPEHAHDHAEHDRDRSSRRSRASEHARGRPPSAPREPATAAKPGIHAKNRKTRPPDHQRERQSSPARAPRRRRPP